MNFTVTINCPYCGEAIEQDWKDYVVGSDVVDENREMGAETEHYIECNEFTCPHCGRKFKVSGSIWEYPENAYNDDDLEAISIND